MFQYNGVITILILKKTKKFVGTYASLSVFLIRHYKDDLNKTYM